MKTCVGLLAWLSLFHAILAQNLGIRLDGAASQKQNFLWSSVVELQPNSARLSDDDLKVLAAKAHLEMTKDYISLNLGLRGGPPVVMATLAVGQKLYFASSNRRVYGGGEYYTTGASQDTLNARVIQELFRCELNMDVTLVVNRQGNSGDTSQHANAGACGEIMAILTWDLDNPGKPVDTLTDTRIVAVTLQKTNGVGTNQIVVKAPCSKPPVARGRRTVTYGCSDFLGRLGVNAIIASNEEEVIQDRLVGISIDRTYHVSIVCPRPE